MTITALTKHDDHDVSIHLCRNPKPHYAAMRCIKCDKHIQWLSQSEYTELKEAGLISKMLPRGNWL